MLLYIVTVEYYIIFGQTARIYGQLEVKLMGLGFETGTGLDRAHPTTYNSISALDEILYVD